MRKRVSSSITSYSFTSLGHPFTGKFSSFNSVSIVLIVKMVKPTMAASIKAITHEPISLTNLSVLDIPRFSQRIRLGSGASCTYKK